MARARKPAPTFQVVFGGSDLVPERVPLRALLDTLAAIQRLATGDQDDPDEGDEIADEIIEDTINLLDVRRGSAVYQCVAHRPQITLTNLKSAGAVLEQPENGFSDSQDFMLSPIRELSRVARQLDCNIQIRLPGRSGDELAIIDASAYGRLAGSAITRGATSLRGRVVRVGGATENRCALRIPGRRRLLYCDVVNQELSREIGLSLYQDIIAHGDAQWVLPSWRLYSFRVNSIGPAPRGRLVESIDELYRSGGNAWDDIKDAQAYLEERRL